MKFSSNRQLVGRVDGITAVEVGRVLDRCNDNSYDPSEIVLARGGKILFRLYGAAERDETWEKAKECISDTITGMGGTVEYLTEL